MSLSFFAATWVWSVVSSTDNSQEPLCRTQAVPITSKDPFQPGCITKGWAHPTHSCHTSRRPRERNAESKARKRTNTLSMSHAFLSNQLMRSAFMEHHANRVCWSHLYCRHAMTSPSSANSLFRDAGNTNNCKNLSYIFTSETIFMDCFMHTLHLVVQW